MNLIADEDDFMESLADDVADRCVAWLETTTGRWGRTSSSAPASS